MSYQGFTSIMTAYSKLLKAPRVLEIGIDRGQTSLPLIHNLTTIHNDFKWVGVDVRRDSCLIEQFGAMIDVYSCPGDLNLNDPGWNICYLEANSLDILPIFAAREIKFDLILIDGDHNYATVMKELDHLNAISHDSSLVIVDDYAGRWANKDLYYKERESHRDIKLLTVPEATEGKQGVNQAIDDWLDQETGWKSVASHDCILLHRDCVDLELVHPTTRLSDSGISYKIDHKKADRMTGEVRGYFLDNECVRTLPKPPSYYGLT